MADVACGFRTLAQGGLLETPIRPDRLALGLLPQARPHGTGRPRRHRPPDRPAGPRADRGRRRAPARADPGLLPPGSSTATSWPGPTIGSTSCARPARRPCPASRWRSTSRPAGWSSTSSWRRTPTPRSGRCSIGWPSSRASSGSWIATSASGPSCSGILRAGAFFLVRRHASTCRSSRSSRSESVGRCDAGEIFEQPIWVDDPECEGRRYRLRRIVLRLDRPTREGETEIVLITNLPDDDRGGPVLRGLPRPLGDRGAFPKADRPAALRDPDPGLPPRGAVRLLHVGRGRQCPGGPEGEPAGGPRRRDGRRVVDLRSGQRGGRGLPGDDDGGAAGGVDVLAGLLGGRGGRAAE